jgi:hypothetical protein
MESLSVASIFLDPYPFAANGPLTPIGWALGAALADGVIGWVARPPGRGRRDAGQGGGAAPSAAGTSR